MTAYERGVFGTPTTTTLEDLLSSDQVVLTMDPMLRRNQCSWPTSPGKPQLTDDFNGPLKTFCLQAGIGTYASMGSWRREFLSFMACTTSYQEAKELASHASAGEDTFSHHDFETGDLEVSE